jgi:hypothetical protein
MASDHHHSPHHECGEHHSHSESCGHKGEVPHVFNRGDLLRHYQTLERIATMMPPELLELELVVQLDALVGAFENHLSHSHSHDHCHDSHHHEEETHHEGACDHDHGHSFVDPYEEALQDDISLLEYRNRIKASYKPLHPAVYDFKSWPIEPTLLALLRQHPAFLELTDTSGPLNFDEKHPLLRLMPVPSAAEVRDVPESLAGRLRELLKEVSPGVFVFEFLPPSFCDQLLEEIDHFEAFCKKTGEVVHRPNSMNNYGAILDDFGFERCLEQLVSQVLNVLSSFAYPYIGATLDHHHGFVVAYEMGKDVNLDMHVDDADITLNICLGKQFTKGDLLFAGVRCHHHQRTTFALPGEQVFVEHKVGQACLHVGRHRHAATGIDSGERFNLIVWARSSKFRRLDTLLDCPDWCPISALIDSQDQTTIDEASPSE